MSFKEFKDKARIKLKKLWWFLWEDESIWSWIVNIILAFVLIKFIVYPGLGLLFGTSYPIVAVVSGSMEHDGSFDQWLSSSAICEMQSSGILDIQNVQKTQVCSQEDWYKQYGISKEVFEEYKLHNGFNKGDIIFLKSAKDAEIGDILVFMTPYRPEPIIHRIIKIEENAENSSKKIYQTKGDHNSGSGKYDMDINESQVLGKSMFKVPLLGWIKIGFVNFLSLFGLHVS